MYNRTASCHRAGFTPSWVPVQKKNVGSGVATGWTGMDVSTPLLLEVTPEIDTNQTSFTERRGGLVRSLRLQTPVIGSHSALAMSVHPTYFDLAMPLNVGALIYEYPVTLPPRLPSPDTVGADTHSSHHRHFVDDPCCNAHYYCSSS